MGAVEYIKKSEVMKLRARSKSSTHLDINAGLLTRPVRIGGRSVAWPRYEIDTLNAARLSGKSDDEIRQIVEALHIARFDA
jgi:prophage regulatory protein